MDLLVTTQWFSQHLADSDLVVLDCTVTTIPHDDAGFHTVSGRPDDDVGHTRRRPANRLPPSPGRNWSQTVLRF